MKKLFVLAAVLAIVVGSEATSPVKATVTSTRKIKPVGIATVTRSMERIAAISCLARLFAIAGLMVRL